MIVLMLHDSKAKTGIKRYPLIWQTRGFSQIKISFYQYNTKKQNFIYKISKIIIFLKFNHFFGL